MRGRRSEGPREGRPRRRAGYGACSGIEIDMQRTNEHLVDHDAREEFTNPYRPSELCCASCLWRHHRDIIGLGRMGAHVLSLLRLAP